MSVRVEWAAAGVGLKACWFDWEGALGGPMSNDERIRSRVIPLTECSARLVVALELQHAMCITI